MFSVSSIFLRDWSVFHILAARAPLPYSLSKGAFTLTAVGALHSPFGPKALSSVRFRWCESINCTRVHIKSSRPAGPLDSPPNADLPEDEGASIGPILIRLQV